MGKVPSPVDIQTFGDCPDPQVQRLVFRATWLSWWQVKPTGAHKVEQSSKGTTSFKWNSLMGKAGKGFESQALRGGGEDERVRQTQATRRAFAVHVMSMTFCANLASPCRPGLG